MAAERAAAAERAPGAERAPVAKRGPDDERRFQTQKKRKGAIDMVDAPVNFEADGEVRWLRIWGWPLSERRLAERAPVAERAPGDERRFPKKKKNEGSH